MNFSIPLLVLAFASISACSKTDEFTPQGPAPKNEAAPPTALPVPSLPAPNAPSGSTAPGPAHPMDDLTKQEKSSAMPKPGQGDSHSSPALERGNAPGGEAKQ